LITIIPLTLLVSLLLAGLFIILSTRSERAALLPIAVDPRPKVPVDHHDHHDHGHGAAGCGCRDGSRPPCHGCLKRTAGR
jgi:hypothetical protein